MRLPGQSQESLVPRPSERRSTRQRPARRPVRRRSPASELWIDSLPRFVRVANCPDQPWKIARMNKFTFALALGAGLVLSLAATNAQADPIVQTLTPATLSSVTFKSLYAPDTTVLTQPFSFMNT